MCRVQRGTAAFELSRWFCMNRSSSTIMVQRRQGRTACRNVHIAQNKVHDDIYRLTLFSHHHHPSIDIKQKEICKPILTLLLCILLCCLGFLTKAEGFVVIRFFFPELTIRRSHVGAERYQCMLWTIWTSTGSAGEWRSWWQGCCSSWNNTRIRRRTHEKVNNRIRVIM